MQLTTIVYFNTFLDNELSPAHSIIIGGVIEVSSLVLACDVDHDVRGDDLEFGRLAVGLAVFADEGSIVGGTVTFWVVVGGDALGDLRGCNRWYNITVTSRERHGDTDHRQL